LEKFMLTNASATAAPAAPGSVSSSEAHTYRLVANEAALAPHTGKKLEITGTLDGPSTTAPNPAPSGSSASTANTPKLIVESGKIISATCTD